MPDIEEKTFYGLRRLNLLYLVSSLLMLAALVWMFWDDYDRSWKKNQKAFFSLKRAKLEASLAEAQGVFQEGRLEQYQALQARLEEAQARHEALKRDRKAGDLQAQIDGAEARVYRLQHRYQFVKSRWDAAKYRYEKALFERGEENAVEEKSALERLAADQNTLKAQLEDNIEELRSLKAKLEPARSELEAVRRSIAELTREQDRLQEAIETLEPNLVNTFRNAPVVDFIDPSININDHQVVLPGLRNDLHFRLVPKVDRCVVCHMGIDKEAYQDDEQPLRSHPRLDLYVSAASPHSLREFGCTVCHEGQGEAVQFSRAAHTPVSREQEQDWKERYGWDELEHWDYPMFPKGYVQASCHKCHEVVRDLDGGETISRGWEIIFERGCLGCHKVEGLEGFKRIGPDLTNVGNKVGRRWLINWLKHPKEYLPKTIMPDYSFSEQAAADLAAYVMTFKEPGFEKLPDPPRGDAAEGRSVYARSACVTCHAKKARDKGYIGPNFGKVGNKINRKWLFYWLENPRRKYTNTLVPFMPKYNFTEQEIADLSKYIMEEHVDWDLLEMEEELEPLPPVTPDQVKRGERLFKDYSCGGCHPSPVSGEDWLRNAPDLTTVGDKHAGELSFGRTRVRRTLRDYIFSKIKDPAAFRTPDFEPRMPHIELSDEDIYGVTVALLGLVEHRGIARQYKVPRPPERVFNPQGPFREIVSTYACLTCHTIRGNGGTLAPDLTLEGSRVQPAWLEKFLAESYSIRSSNLMPFAMPILNLTKTQIEEIVDYTKTVLIDDKIPEDLGVVLSPEMVRKGRERFEKRGCMACHIVDKGGDIGPGFTTGVFYAGDRLKEGFVYKWLENPHAIVPGTLEPRYGFTDTERLELTAFIMSLRNTGEVSP